MTERTEREERIATFKAMNCLDALFDVWERDDGREIMEMLSTTARAGMSPGFAERFNHIIRRAMRQAYIEAAYKVFCDHTDGNMPPTPREKQLEAMLHEIIESDKAALSALQKLGIETPPETLARIERYSAALVAKQ